MVACALYLVCGMALMAMCFNLMQEEATNKFLRLDESRSLTIRHVPRWDSGRQVLPLVSQFEYVTTSSGASVDASAC